MLDIADDDIQITIPTIYHTCKTLETRRYIKYLNWTYWENNNVWDEKYNGMN